MNELTAAERAEFEREYNQWLDQLKLESHATPPDYAPIWYKVEDEDLEYA